MKYVNKLKLVTIFLSLIIATPIYAQIKGRVIDVEGYPVPRAIVKALSEDSIPLNSVTTTNRDGYFSLKVTDTQHSTLILRASHASFEPTYTTKLDYKGGELSVGNIILKSTLLEEVVIVRDQVVHNNYGQSYFPTIEMVKHSQSGYDLLNNIGIPSLMVDVMNKEVKSISGETGKVDLYINERQVSKSDMMALLPDEVLRVEYINNPAVRFGPTDADAAIHFIVKRPISGIAIGLNTTNAITTGNGNNHANIRYNHKASEWGIRYSNNYGVIKNRLIDQVDSYRIGDSFKTTTRKGINTPISYQQHNLFLVYDYFNGEKNLNFRSELGGSFYDSPQRGHKQRISEPNKPDYFSLTEPTEKNHIPSLKLYLKKKFSDKGILHANLVGTYINTEYGYTFVTAKDIDLQDKINKYSYLSAGNRYALIGEVRYQHNISENTTLLSGVIYSHGWLNNRYIDNNDNETRNKLIDYRIEPYSMIWHKFSPKFNAFFNIGAEYLNYSQSSSKVDFFNLKPEYGFSYRITERWRANFRGQVYTAYPSLSKLSDVRQRVNSYEMKAGNPQLKPNRQFTHSLSLSYSKGRFFISNNAFFSYWHKPMAITSELIKDAQGDFYQFMPINARYGINAFDNLNIRLVLIPNKLNLNGGLSYQIFHMKYPEQLLKMDRLYGYGQLNYFYKDFNAGLSFNTPFRSYDSYMEYYSSPSLYAYAKYNYKQCSFGISVDNIFRKEYYSGEKWMHPDVQKDLVVRIPSWGNMVSLTFSWNFNKGRTYKSYSPSISHSTNDGGILKM